MYTIHVFWVKSQCVHYLIKECSVLCSAIKSVYFLESKRQLSVNVFSWLVNLQCKVYIHITIIYVIIVFCPFIRAFWLKIYRRESAVEIYFSSIPCLLHAWEEITSGLMVLITPSKEQMSNIANEYDMKHNCNAFLLQTSVYIWYCIL